MKKWSLIVATLLTFVTASSHAGTSAQVQYGTVQDSRIITQTNTSNSGNGTSTVRTLGGAAIGGALGHQIGGGSGKTVATIAGALAGGAISQRRQAGDTSSATTNDEMVELLIKTNDGKLINVVQDSDPNLTFNKGDKVRVLTTDSGTSVDKSL